MLRIHGVFLATSHESDCKARSSSEIPYPSSQRFPRGSSREFKSLAHSGASEELRLQFFPTGPCPLRVGQFGFGGRAAFFGTTSTRRGESMSTPVIFRKADSGHCHRGCITAAHYVEQTIDQPGMPKGPAGQKSPWSQRPRARLTASIRGYSVGFPRMASMRIASQFSTAGFSACFRQCPNSHGWRVQTAANSASRRTRSESASQTPGGMIPRGPLSRRVGGNVAGFPSSRILKRLWPAQVRHRRQGASRRPSRR